MTTGLVRTDGATVLEGGIPVVPTNGAAPCAASPPPCEAAQWLHIGLALLIAAPFVVFAVALARSDHAWLVQQVPDDAFYYLEVGQRIADGDGVSFDGLNATNGFHPLWQGVVSVLALVWSGDSLVRAALLVGLVCVAAAVALVTTVLARSVGWTPALLAAAVAVHGSSTLSSLVNGMETSVSVLCLAVLVWSLARLGSHPSNRALAIVGAACGACVLARLDFALAVPVLAVSILLRTRAVRSLVPVAAGGAVMVLPFFVWNLGANGMLLTVSGGLKLHTVSDHAASLGGRFSGGYRALVADAVRETLDTAVSNAGELPVRAAAGLGDLLLLVSAGLAVWVVWLHRMRGHRPVRAPMHASTWALVTVAAFIGVKACADHLLLPLWAPAWYSGPVLIALGVALGASAGWLATRLNNHRLRTAGVVGLAAMFALPLNGELLASRSLDTRRWQDGLAATVPAVRERAPSGRLGAYDAGLLGFELHPRPVVNLDGLVNDAEHAELLAHGVDPVELLRHNGIDILVGRFTSSDARLPACADVLWESATGVVYRDAVTGPTSAPIVIASVRHC